VLFGVLLQAEEAVKSQGIEKTSIFRPGLLDRGEKARSLEKLVAGFMSSINVADVAKVMIADAVSRLADKTSSGVTVYEMKKMQAAAGAGTAPS
jgi:oxidoreductase